MNGASLNDVVTIIHETHLDAKPEKRFSKMEVAEAVVEVGMNTLFVKCSDLLGHAWSTKAKAPAPEDDGGEPDSGN